MRNKKRATCFATLPQNELKSDVARFITHVRTCSGGSRGGSRGARLPLFLDENEARRVEKNFFEATPHLSQGLDDRPPPLI